MQAGCLPLGLAPSPGLSLAALPTRALLPTCPGSRKVWREGPTSRAPLRPQTARTQRQQNDAMGE